MDREMADADAASASLLPSVSFDDRSESNSTVTESAADNPKDNWDFYIQASTDPKLRRSIESQSKCHSVSNLLADVRQQLRVLFVSGLPPGMCRDTFGIYVASKTQSSVVKKVTISNNTHRARIEFINMEWANRAFDALNGAKYGDHVLSVERDSAPLAAPTSNKSKSNTRQRDRDRRSSPPPPSHRKSDRHERDQQNESPPPECFAGFGRGNANTSDWPAVYEENSGAQSTNAAHVSVAVPEPAEHELIHNFGFGFGESHSRQSDAVVTKHTSQSQFNNAPFGIGAVRDQEPVTEVASTLGMNSPLLQMASPGSVEALFEGFESAPVCEQAVPCSSVPCASALTAANDYHHRQQSHIVQEVYAKLNSSPQKQSSSSSHTMHYPDSPGFFPLPHHSSVSAPLPQTINLPQPPPHIDTITFPFPEFDFPVISLSGQAQPLQSKDDSWDPPPELFKGFQTDAAPQVQDRPLVNMDQCGRGHSAQTQDTARTALVLTDDDLRVMSSLTMNEQGDSQTTHAQDNTNQAYKHSAAAAPYSNAFADSSVPAPLHGQRQLELEPRMDMRGMQTTEHSELDMYSDVDSGSVQLDICILPDYSRLIELVADCGGSVVLSDMRLTCALQHMHVYTLFARWARGFMRYMVSCFPDVLCFVDDTLSFVDVYDPPAAISSRVMCDVWEPMHLASVRCPVTLYRYMRAMCLQFGCVHAGVCWLWLYDDVVEYALSAMDYPGMQRVQCVTQMLDLALAHAQLTDYKQWNMLIHDDYLLIPVSTD